MSFIYYSDLCPLCFFVAICFLTFDHRRHVDTRLNLTVRAHTPCHAVDCHAVDTHQIESLR
jgi:hypothetical protein